MAGNWIKLSGNPSSAVNMDHVVAVAFDASGARLSLVDGTVLPPAFTGMALLTLKDQGDIDAIKRWLEGNAQ